MKPITFEEFKEKLKDTSDIELRGMARDLDLEVPPHILRDNLLKRLFEVSDIPKRSTPVETSEKPQSSPKVSPGVVYQVTLKAQRSRWRGGCLWRVGTTEIPKEMMSKAMIKALEGDKDFHIKKVKIEE